MKSSVFRIYSFFFYLFILSVVACSQEAKNPSSAAAGPIETEASAREFRIYRDALQQGSTEDIRVDAAVGLLLQNDGQGRDALLLALKSEENPQARQAVCKALIKSRVLSQTIDSLDIFQEPLLRILRGESTEQAKLSAEAMLVFDYSVVAGSLDQIIQNKEIDHQIRMNAVYALQLRPEPTALRGLIKLLDGPDAEVAKAAETALQEAFGIPVGASRTDWLGILDELQLKSPEDIRRERLLRQEMKLRQVQAERDRWQKLYLSALDKQYESLDEANRGEMILDTMGFDLASVRLWALSKASKYPVIGEGLREKLLSLLSDSSREVRLQAAKSLMNMSALNPAAVLLERLKLEEDAEVKLVMLEALGEACFFAFSPGSPIKLSESIKIETLEIAAGYLQSKSSVDCIKGAGIIRKILELNNLSSDSMQSYLGLLNDRYQKSISLDKELRAELLAILAHLCGQGGAKDSACTLFGPLFMDATAVENDPALRLAAVQGISYVDKVRALELFKKNSLMRDPSLAVQQVVIDVAGQTGDTTDLEWLLVLLNGNGHSDRVWLAIKSICQRQEADFLLDWLLGLEGTGVVKGEYVHEILDIVEQKAAGKKDQKLLVWVYEQRISLYVKGKEWEKAAEYIKSRLGLSDIEKDSPLAAMIKGYFSEKEIEHASKMLFFEKMSSIPKEERPNWSVFMGDLDRQLNPPASQEPEVPEGGTGE